ncbi:MAG TPA: hypothetical protein DDZ51_19870 [Planctomycetaceae bacterium]|nr:hypothetical protein [Planctomycetaceae bacterium]
MKFDEAQGELQRFEVSKDEATGVWSLPSRNNYPADAAEQMQAAANSLVGVKVLDIQTENAEDHASLGVVEPKADALDVGDEGVGLLVSFKGDKNATLANLIVGNPVAGSNEKRYVRKPGENPVYVVNFDSKVFSTTFSDWIEKDLLQLSSIDISRVDMQVYDSALTSAGSLSMNRTYDASLEVEAGSDWKLLSLVKYDQEQQPQPVTLAEGEKLATAKLNELKNALDELKIADVASKPKGMSENLKADKDLVSDNEAIRSLAVRGFFPVNTGEILSANGEMSVTLNDGVQYVLRFGNVEGIASDRDPEGDQDPEEPVGGANRYLLVTAQVDESMFPPPALKSIPKTIEELDAMNQPEPADAPAAAEPSAPAAPASPTDPPTPVSPAEPAPEAPKPETPAEPAAAEQPKVETPADPPAPTSESATTEPAAPVADAAADDACADDEPEAKEPAEQEPAEDAPAKPADPPAEPVVTQPAAPTPQPTVEETAEEKQERLEAEQEKITKENQRMLDERKDRVDAARRRVRELNSRFAEWYYVIPESTYRKLRISSDDLIEKPASAEATAPEQVDPASAGPGLQLPGLGN